MQLRNRVLWALAAALCIALLIAPALWNGFPLLQNDTGGYLARWYEGYLVTSRAVVYGLILNAGSLLAFWPVVIVQSALTVWIVALMLRAHGFANRPALVAGIVVVLCIATTLPWLTAILLTDIFCGLGVLALYLLLLRGDALGRGERIGLIVLVAVSAATHSATLAVLLGLLMAAAIVSLFARTRISFAAVGRGIVALALGAAMTFAANFLVAKQLAWTPGGFALSFGRMLQDGIVKKYLDEHCPDPALRLCAHKDELPTDADMWFWGSDLFNKLGRFAGMDSEMETIATRSVIAYPALQAKAAAVAAVRQLLEVRTGEGIVNYLPHTRGIIERYLPDAVPSMMAARQQKADISFTEINWIDYPAGLLAMALLPVIIVFARGERFRRTRELAGFITIAILGNAVVCGVFSNPHDRYGARIVWLASLTVLIALITALRQPEAN
jgi:hypothetical protein